MGFRDLFDAVVERFEATGDARSVYGEPVELENKTVVPVARVGYGLGGGFGSGCDEDSGDEAGGLGGGISVTPIGVMEITPDGTRYVPLNDRRKLVGAGLIGLALGLVIGLRWWGR